MRVADQIGVNSDCTDGTPGVPEPYGSRIIKQDRLDLGSLVRSIKFYFIRQGFRDGLPGLIHIAIGCFNSFMKYAKMLERQHSDAALR